MSLTLFTGLPGSGKSKHLIDLVNRTRSSGRPVVTMLSADAQWIMGFDSYNSERRLASREPGGASCPIDFYVPTSDIERALASLQPGTLVAVEEAQMFGPSAVTPWVEASERGIDLVLVSPSSEHIRGLADVAHAERRFALPCELCALSDAATVVILPESDRTLSVCRECFRSEAEKARARTFQLLLDELPHRGERALYQPVELAECADWHVSRPDSEARAAVLREVVREQGLIGPRQTRHVTYLDVGCSTGFFCNALQEMGIFAKGVDAVENNVVIAKLLDSFVRRERRTNKKFATYVCADAYEYLRKSVDETFDIVSAFSVIQWVMVQRSLREALECFDWVFAKTKRICVVEMGYSSQDRYGELLPILVDREWVHSLMTTQGGFDDLIVVEAGNGGIMRDLFIGVRHDA
mgnify:CR=1 FL=1